MDQNWIKNLQVGDKVCFSLYGGTHPNRGEVVCNNPLKAEVEIMVGFTEHTVHFGYNGYARTPFVSATLVRIPKEEV